MKSVNMLEAKTHLSKLVDRIARGQDREIVISRNGRPAARLVPLATGVAGKRIGLLKGKLTAPSLERFDKHNARIVDSFLAED